jgi:Family of unknown function (DUF5906)
MKSRRVPIHHALGPQEHFTVVEHQRGIDGPFVYTVTVTHPDGGPLFPPLEVENPREAADIAMATAQAIVRTRGVAFGYNNQPYLWRGNRWVNSDRWLKALSLSVNVLLRTGRHVNRQSHSVYNFVYDMWAAKCECPMDLKPFGRCEGIPVEDCVIVIDAAGQPNFVPHSPDHENLHVLPVQSHEVSHEYLEMQMGQREQSLLFRFLESSLTEDQRVTLRRWFGLHLVVHRVGNPEKLLYMFGPGGNGKGVVTGLLRALITTDAVATLRLKDLLISSNLELLIGKLSMIGTENKPETDNNILKTLTSWEPITVNPKYRDPFEVRAQCLITQASNPAPHFDDDSDAMVRRVIALDMQFQPGADRIVGIADKVALLEYPLLVAWALQGAAEVVADGTITVPPAIVESSARVVRPVRAIDRFMGQLEFGPWEVAEDELYQAYCITCAKQRLTLRPRGEFVDELRTRLTREGKVFERREKAVGYNPAVAINDRGERGLLVPQLHGVKSVTIYLGLRIAEGPYGGPIGQPIPATRRGLPSFEAVVEEPAAP